MAELDSYGADLLMKPMIAVITKMDLPENREPASKLRIFLEAKGMAVHEVSAITGQGLKELLFATARVLKTS
jgi:GTP-binding protein